MVYIISDIHGRKDRFDDILKRTKLRKKDTFYGKRFFIWLFSIDWGQPARQAFAFGIP